MKENDMDGTTIPSRIKRIEWVVKRMPEAEDNEALLGVIYSLQEEIDELGEMVITAIDERDTAAAREYQRETSSTPVSKEDDNDAFTEVKNLVPSQDPPRHFKTSADDEGRTNITFGDKVKDAAHEDDDDLEMPF